MLKPDEVNEAARRIEMDKRRRIGFTLAAVCAAFAKETEANSELAYLQDLARRAVKEWAGIKKAAE